MFVFVEVFNTNQNSFDTKQFYHILKWTSNETQTQDNHIIDFICFIVIETNQYSIIIFIPLISAVWSSCDGRLNIKSNVVYTLYDVHSFIQSDEWPNQKYTTIKIDCFSIRYIKHVKPFFVCTSFCFLSIYLCRWYTFFFAIVTCYCFLFCLFKYQFPSISM